MAEIVRSELRVTLEQLRPYIVKAAIISFIAGLFSLAPVIYMRVLYGPVINSSSEINLLWITFLLLLVMVMLAVLEYYRSQILVYASLKFSELMSARVFRACFQANLSGVSGANQGLHQLRQIRNFISSKPMAAIVEAPVGIVFLLLIFEIHPTMGIFSLLGAALTAILSFWTEKNVHPEMNEAQKFSNIATGFVSSSGRNAQVVEAMGMNQAIKNIWYLHHERFLHHQAKASANQATGSASSKFVMMVQGSAMLGIGTYLTLIAHLPPEAAGSLIIAKILGGKAIQPVMQLIMQWKQVSMTREAYDQLSKFLLDVPTKAKTMSLPEPKGYLSVEGLALRAPGTHTTVVANTSFKLEQGAILAVIGPSGSGKSSLSRGLVGIWHPLVGSVRLDGANIAQWNKDELGEHIGYLPQDIELFDGTLADNIARFSDHDQEKLDKVIKLVGLDDFINLLPEGVDTSIGVDGALLSGGQRQRVGLARALYGDPKLIVLDEPNSNLDIDGEKKLVDILNYLRQQKRTVVFVTHRPDIIRLSDYVLVMNDGVPKAFGPASAILEKLSQKVDG